MCEKRLSRLDGAPAPRKGPHFPQCPQVAGVLGSAASKSRVFVAWMINLAGRDYEASPSILKILPANSHGQQKGRTRSARKGGFSGPMLFCHRLSGLWALQRALRPFRRGPFGRDGALSRSETRAMRRWEPPKLDVVTRKAHRA